MSILIANKLLETETEAWYTFYVDTLEDIKDLPTSKSMGASYKVKKLAKPASIAYCIEMAAQYALDDNDEWRLLYALRADVADAILKNNHIPHISIFISAPFQVRTQHVMDVRNMDMKEAVRFLKKMDRQHKRYYEFYTGEKWGKPENYDLCINSANYGIKETIDVIKRLLNQQAVQHN